MISDKVVLGLFCLICVASCTANQNKSKSNDDTINSGSITVCVDESLRPLMEAELEVFGNQNQKTKLTVRFKPETDVLRDFIDDSARAIILTRELTSAEMEYFKSIQFIPRSMPFAKDAIALVTAKESAFDSLSMETLVQMLQGREASNTVIVFDNPGSGTFRWIRDSLLKNELPAKNCSALQHSEEVISYVTSHPNSIGIIGNNILSNLNDSAVRNNLKRIKRLKIATFGTTDYTLPFQSEIETRRYPLTRMVYCIQKDGKVGLGTGLQRFLYDETGQLIVLKSGMMPFKQPERSVHFNE